MTRKKREYTKENLLYFQKKYLIPKLRQVSQWWKYKNIAKNKSKVNVEVGIYKNGTPKYKIKYQCAHCNGLFDDIEMDHIKPVVNTNDSFIDWNTYIGNLLCDDTGYQSLCHNCHLAKSAKEMKKRVKSRKK